VKEYFNLYPHCVPINGKLGTTLYDFKNNTIYHLQSKESLILRGISRGERISKLKETHGAKNVENLLNLLTEKKIGEYGDTFVPREPYRKGSLKALQLDENIPLLNCFIELPCSCPKNCSHCYSPKINGCFACKKVANNYVLSNRDLGFYYNLVRDIISLGFSNIYFHGGDPLTNWGVTKEILQFSSILKLSNQKLYLLTNGKMLNEERANFLIQFNIVPIILFDYTTDSIDLKTIEEISHYFKEHVNQIIFNVVTSRNNVKKLNCLKQQLSELGIANIIPSIVINGKEESILYHEELPTFGCDINSFSYLGIYHPCLTGSLAITSDKKVVPCPRLESEVLMDLKEHNSLLDLFDRKEEVLKYWKLSLENIEPCGTCEFKRMCMDCRAAEVAFSNSLTQKSLCSYTGL